MGKDTIDEQTFRRLCEEAWTWAETEGEMGHPVNKYSPQVPFLFGMKTGLWQYFGIKDETEGVYCKEGEVHSQAYLRRIGGILEGRVSPPFEYNLWLNRFVTRANEKYAEREPSRPSKSRKRGRKR